MAGHTNASMNAALKAKNDEFYTLLTDIEKEMRYYRKHFKDKTVLCNCDDPFESNFFKYFALNFNRLGLKKLIATCYYSSPIAGHQLQYGFDSNGQMTFGLEDKRAEKTKNKRPYKAVVTQVYDKMGDGGVDMLDVAELFRSGENELVELEGNGDFRSPECLALLDEADIVVTNPPFSLFRDYVAVLMEHQKKFIIIGNSNAITYKEVFPLIVQDKLWLGVTRSGTGSMWFRVMEDFPEKTGQKIEKFARKIKRLQAKNAEIRHRAEIAERALRNLAQLCAEGARHYLQSNEAVKERERELYDEWVKQAEKELADEGSAV